MAELEVAYSVHAEERMRERRIGRNQVERTVRQPDSVIQQGNDRIRVERRTSEGNLIVVIYVDRIGGSGREAYVVTVFRK